MEIGNWDLKFRTLKIRNLKIWNLKIQNLWVVEHYDFNENQVVNFGLWLRLTTLGLSKSLIMLDVDCTGAHKSRIFVSVIVWFYFHSLNSFEIILFDVNKQKSEVRLTINRPSPNLHDEQAKSWCCSLLSVPDHSNLQNYFGISKPIDKSYV